MPKIRVKALLSALCCAFFCLFAFAEFPGEIRLSFVSPGGSDLIGAYRPFSVRLGEEKPASLRLLPPGLESPRFAVLPIKSAGGRAYHVVVDERGGGSFLYVDREGRGDMSAAAPSDWSYYVPKKDEARAGGGMIDMDFGDRVLGVYVGMYMFDKADPKRSSMKDSLLFYRDYAYKGHVRVGDKELLARLDDEYMSGDFRGKDDPASSGVTLLLDLSGDGSFIRSQGEYIDVRKPFSYKGYTYRVSDMSAAGDSFRIVSDSPGAPKFEASRIVADGKVPAFKAKDLDGAPLSFPGDYKGKLVLLDFWASWCEPCMSEMPTLTGAYAEFAGKGFEVLGVSLDIFEAARLRETMKAEGMAWRQLYDRKGWEGEIVRLYGVKSIPHSVLVDGDTGEILAEGMRGMSMYRMVSYAMRTKFGD